MSNEKERFINRIELSTNTTFESITNLVDGSKLIKHSEIRSFLSEKLGLTYGDANTLTHYVLKSDGVSLAEGKSHNQIVSEIYSDKKNVLLPIHETIMSQVELFGDFEIIPKKGYLSLKQKRQFMMIGPKSNTRIEIGINLKDLINNDRFIPQPKGSMCQYIVKISNIDEVDRELLSVLKKAYDQSA